jgi:type IV pilus assembly protein PilC
MADFSYTARTKDGRIEKDVLTAANQKAAAEMLRSQGLTPSSIKEVSRQLDIAELFGRLRPVKLIDKITFIKNLGVMVKAGLPISKSLKILSEQTSNKKFADIVADVSRQVEGGTSLNESLGKYPNVFSGIFISMVKVGEVSGNLEQNLGYLSEQMQRDYDIISKARGAMTYPIVVMVALVLVGITMFTFVLPKLTSTFKEFDVELPLITKVVIGIVDFFAAYGLLVFPFLILLAFGFMYWRKTSSGKTVIHKAVLYMPVFAPIVKKINMARFVGIFSSLLKSGMPIVDALNVAGDVLGNIYYKQVVKDASAKVKVGSPLALAFKKNPKLFEPLVVQMMEVGEESGTVDLVLAEVARFYEQEVDQTMKNLSSILEPVLMLIIGSAVGVLAVALISPIYSITQNV